MASEVVILAEVMLIGVLNTNFSPHDADIMCDTVLASADATADGAVLLAKNSDREPGEAQVVEWHPRRQHTPGEVLPCTWQSIPQTSTTWQNVLSRPFWMWGAEMGANEQGLTVANQAVFTRFAVADQGLTGMDLVRIAVERATSARDAIDVIVDHIARFGQGGRCGYRHRNFRYDSSFALADSEEAWILETAGPFWAARRIEGIWSLSNALTIGSEYHRISDGAEDYARRQGWIGDGEEFSFRDAFSNRGMDWLAGARHRRRCLLEQLDAHHGSLRPHHLVDALRSHDETPPHRGLRMSMPCAHASWLPTRSSGQAVGSMVSRLKTSESIHWLTGTSSPCLSIFKPVVLRGEAIDFGPPPLRKGYDDESLFWRHERLHRKMITRHLHPFALPDSVEKERRSLEEKAFPTDIDNLSADACSTLWRRHRKVAPRWADAVDAPPLWKTTPHVLYWHYQNWLDGVPL